MQPEQIFTAEVLAGLFPASRTHEFFEALFGDDAEGAYDISLLFVGYDAASKRLDFQLNLNQRPGCCLACNLTHGLPEVFKRHPIINLKGLVADIEKQLGGKFVCREWEVGHTVQQDTALHYIPLHVYLKDA